MLTVVAPPLRGLQRVARGQFKENAHSFLLVKNALLKNKSICSARLGESLYLGVVMFFDCRYSYFPPLKMSIKHGIILSW